MTPRLHVRHVLLIGAVGLVAPTVAVLCIDVLNVGGVRDAIADHVGRPYELWPVLYMNGSVVEWVQWGLMGTAGLLAAGASSHARLRGWPRHARMFALMGAGLLLMLLEDSGDIRHFLSERVLLDILVIEESSLVRLLVEGTWFAVVAAPMVLAVRDWPTLRGDRVTLRLLAGGYLCYAIASLSSWSSNLGWYHYVGARIMDRVLGGRLVSAPTEGFWFMDQVYEESVELVAATLLCAAVVAYRQRWLAVSAVPSEGPGDRADTASPAGP